jgi:RHS repeat-associated protein
LFGSDSGGGLYRDRLNKGIMTKLATGSYTPASSVPIKIKVYETDLDYIKVWVNGTLAITQSIGDPWSGGVAFSGKSPKFSSLKVGYDNNGDDDIDDAGDDVVVNEDFCSTSATPAYDHAGNLITDAAFVYVYDAWNRLVKVRSKNDADVTIQTADFDALGRRIKKVAANSGDNNQNLVYYYDGQKIIEIRNGSNAMVQQFIHGMQYIDELVMVRVKNNGDLYVHQDANWNVVGLTDLGGRLVERYAYSPYGELIVHQSTGYCDYDGDGDVDSSDRNLIAGACAGSNPAGACRILDLNFDNTVNSSDTTPFDALPQGLQRNPGRLSTAVSQPFAHQGLLFEPEIGSYQNRARQYDPAKRRFAQRDPLPEALALLLQTEVGPAGNAGLYLYVHANPIVNTDPEGLWPNARAYIAAWCIDNRNKDCKDACAPGQSMRSCGVCRRDWNNRHRWCPPAN